MSVTYGIACTQCKQILWVGQGSIIYDEEVDEKYKGEPDLACHFCFATCTGKCGEKEVKP